MKEFKQLADSVIYRKVGSHFTIVDKSDELEIVGKGRSAYVFRIRDTDVVLKVFFPTHLEVAKEEAIVYQSLQENAYFPNMYDYGENYLVIDYIKGNTLFQCLAKGKPVEKQHIMEIDYALNLARGKGLNPSDIHLRNIIITTEGSVKLIDVARYRQKKSCSQWADIKRAHKLYRKSIFPKQLSPILLNGIAYLYKKGMLGWMIRG